jgi:energy-converting hydrogenase Eha subunit A
MLKYWRKGLERIREVLRAIIIVAKMARIATAILPRPRASVIVSLVETMSLLVNHFMRRQAWTCTHIFLTIFLALNMRRMISSGFQRGSEKLLRCWDNYLGNACGKNYQPHTSYPSKAAMEVVTFSVTKSFCFQLPMRMLAREEGVIPRPSQMQPHQRSN